MARSARRSRGFMCVPAFTVQPSITGTAQSGQTLTGADGTIVRGSVSARQWLRDGVAIGGATGATYEVQPEDVGAVVTFAVTAAGTLNSVNKVTAISAPTGEVIAA
nr:hypothetical protein [Sphingomonas sp. Y57]